MSHVFLAGASQGVGREILKGLLAQHQKVKAFVRSESVAAELQTMGVETAIGDALNSEQITQAMAGSPIDLVISTIGGKPQQGERADYKGNQNLIDAAVKAGVKRFILVTSIGSGESAAALPPQAFSALKDVLAEKEKAEQHLIASGLTYTIIRPGGLKSEPATGNGVLTEDPKIAGSIHRADVAQLVCRCVDSDRANNKILSAVDRAMTYSPAPFEEFTP
ncbi:MAG: SDR family oxidoreductase [Phormidesmis sp. CAN_BIN44]|nr:SDR family oxidoreductase [Phormidesmis sp. CAN_BIN44]